MKIIPAIDLKNGLVVHARGGRRNGYQPLSFAKFPSPQLPDVVARLNRHDLFYIADLDAIGGGAKQSGALEALRRSRPELRLWVDVGIRKRADFDAFDAPNAIPIVGSETLADAALVKALAHDGVEYILSLDFSDGELLGPQQLLKDPQDWPPIVIALSLTAIGGGTGPELRLFERIRRLHPQGALVYGGGVGDAQDLKNLSAAGADACLLANAIYTGAIALTDL